MLRFAIAQDRDYEFDVLSESDGEVLVAGGVQPEIRVSATPDRPWCSCDEDSVPGTCTHVLFLAALDHPVAETIREYLKKDLELTTEEISELSHTLTARKQERKALSEALRLLGAQRE